MFEKLPSGYRLTDVGEEVLEYARQMEASSNELAARVFGRDQSVRGQLRVTLAPTLATHLLMPDFAEFATLYPEIEMDILSSDETVNLTNREADVAIRVVYNRNTLPLNLHALKGPELFGAVTSRAIFSPPGGPVRPSASGGSSRSSMASRIGGVRLRSRSVKFRSRRSMRERILRRFGRALE
jgi:hypothetical protein